MSELQRRLAAACGWTEIETRPGKAGFYDVDMLTGIPPIRRIEQWKAQQLKDGLSIYWELPDYANDDAACLDALEATAKQWRLHTIGSAYQCIISDNFLSDVAEDAWANGATRREAMVKALCRFYGIEVTE